jgi:hypothetical protein
MIVMTRTAKAEVHAGGSFRRLQWVVDLVPSGRHLAVPGPQLPRFIDDGEQFGRGGVNKPLTPPTFFPPEGQQSELNDVK